MNILFIDDDRMILEIVGEMLSGVGHQVKLISNPQEAVFYAWKKESDIDLIISDIHMPGMSGTTVVGKIREIHPHAEAIFFSGDVDIIVPGKLLKKPCTLGSLEKAIAEAAGRRRTQASLRP